ncbi:MAG TPA: Lrp/AsnC family transcriptional regulator, partial [Nitrososphaera sp.]|nr:Lrp/AsnC family transcriptional regulator [Nitrososphaera sp.]
SHSGLVSDEEIVQKLQDALRHFRRRSLSQPAAMEGIEAYVLLNCDLGLEDSVVKSLMAVPEVSEVKGVFGVYDFVVRIRTDSEEQIKQAIARVRSIETIKSSLTMMVIENQNATKLER